MKRLTYLMTMLFAILVLTTSCEKEDPITPEEIVEGITVNDLVGDWSFYSFTFEGRTVYDCDTEFNEDWDYVTLSFLNVTTSTLDIYTDCMDSGELDDYMIDYDYTLEKDGNKVIINCRDKRKFEILNIDSFNGTELELKLIYSTSLSLCVGAEYVLKK